MMCHWRLASANEVGWSKPPIEKIVGWAKPPIDNDLKMNFAGAVPPWKLFHLFLLSFSLPLPLVGQRRQRIAIID